MIKRKDDLVNVTKCLREGNGEANIQNLLSVEELDNKGKLFAKVVLKPGVSVGEHNHDGDFEAYYILKGEGKYIDNGEEKRVYAGDVTLTKNGESHSMINDTEEDLEMIALVINN
ncbi:cupin domain-containing protein [Clostridium sp. DL1XJH146]